MQPAHPQRPVDPRRARHPRYLNGASAHVRVRGQDLRRGGHDGAPLSEPIGTGDMRVSGPVLPSIRGQLVSCIREIMHEKVAERGEKGLLIMVSRVLSRAMRCLVMDA